METHHVILVKYLTMQLQVEEEYVHFVMELYTNLQHVIILHVHVVVIGVMHVH